MTVDSRLVSRRLAGIVAALLCSGPMLEAQVDFEAPRIAIVPDRSISTGVQPTAFRAADLDGDGRPELVVASLGGLVVYRYDDVHGFVESQFHLTTTGSGPVFVRDLDDDGDADVLVVREDDLHVFRNDGSGTLSPAFAPSTGGSNHSAVVGDFGSDGAEDVVVVQLQDSRIATLFGDGNANFGLPVPTPTGSSPLVAAGADFDEDGFRDVIVKTHFALDVYLGDGTGAFPATLPVSSGITFHSIVARDFDGDFHADVAVSSSGALHVFLGRGDGTFDSSQVSGLQASGSSIVSEDLDGDGDPDVAVDGTVLWNDGNGDFSGEPPTIVGCLPSPFASSDFTADGIVDFAGVDDGGAWLLEGASGGAFPSPRAAASPFDEWIGSSQVALADVDRDGRLDVIRARTVAGDGFVEWIRADGAGGFGPPSEIASSIVRFDGLAVGDFDGDFDVDLAMLAGEFLDVRLGDGAGTFLLDNRTLAHPSAFGPMIALDLDQDGRDDIVSALSLDEQSLAIQLATGDGGFTSPAIADAGTFPTSLAAADFDEDGLSDLLVGKRAATDAFVMRGDGAGGLAVVNGFEIGLAFVSTVRAFDADDDGHADAAIISEQDSADPSVWIARGRGDGTFVAPERILGGDGRPTDAAAADFDGDGRTEITASVERGAFGESERVAIATRGAGDAISETASIARCGGAADSIEVLDFDEDGSPDLLLDGAILVRNRSLDPIRCRRGAVNAGAGPIANVLLCNGSPGLGDQREVRVTPATPFTIEVLGTPFDPDGPVRFALYAWIGVVPSTSTVRALPFGLGVACLPMPLVPGAFPQPRVVWNQLGHRPLLGEADFPSNPGPSVVASRPNGLAREVTFTLQGLALDPAGRNGVASATNAVIVVCE